MFYLSLYLSKGQSFQHNYEKYNISFVFRFDLRDFPGIGSSKNLPVSFSACHFIGTIEFGPVIYCFTEMKIPVQNVKANVNLHIWIVPWRVLTATASWNVEGLLLNVSTVRTSTKF